MMILKLEILIPHRIMKEPGRAAVEIARPWQQMKILPQAWQASSRRLRNIVRIDRDFHSYNPSERRNQESGRRNM